jgi:hypothetical protein
MKQAALVEQIQYEQTFGYIIFPQLNNFSWHPSLSILLINTISISTDINIVHILKKYLQFLPSHKISKSRTLVIQYFSFEN